MLHQARLILVALALSTSAAAAPKVAFVDDKTFAKTVLEPRKGKAVLVSFWASYCVPCLKELPELEKLKASLKKKGTPADVVLVSVDPPDVKLDKAPSTKDLAIETLQVKNEDPQPFIDAIDKKWMGEVPFAAIYGKDGKLLRTLSGEQTLAELEKALQEALR